MDPIEAHDVHHALSVTIQLLREVGAQSGAPLTAESEDRLIAVARRLDHERRCVRDDAPDARPSQWAGSGRSPYAR